MLFFTSDQHFGHKAITHMDNRPFEGWQEHDQGLIDAWNSVVTNNDVVYQLGDFSYKCSSKYALEIAMKLHGKRIYFLKGNHDGNRQEFISACDDRFVCLGRYHELSIDGRNVVLCHFPIESWSAMHRGTWHIHGHTHGKSRRIASRLDVSVTGPHIRPWSLEEVIACQTVI